MANRKTAPAAQAGHDYAAQPTQGEYIAARIGRFGTSGNVSLPVIERNVREQVPTITMAAWLSSPRAAQLGYLINRLLTAGGSEPGHRYTLFSNSALEAMYAVIRLTRQAARKNRGPNAHKILIYDARDQYRTAFDPLASGAAAALCPEVHFAGSAAEVEQLVNADRGSWAATIMIRYPDRGISHELQGFIDRLSHDTGAMKVVSHSEVPIFDGSMFTVPDGTDIVIFGEPLTNREVPFGAFSVSEAAYETWNNRQSLATYTSTFYGNTTSLSVALETLRRCTTWVTDLDEQVLLQIERDFDTRMDYFIRYVHPVFAEMFKVEKADLNILSAQGSHIQLANGKRVMDLSGLGCSLRGANPPDVIDTVLGQYAADHDYLADITAELREMTPFGHILPSVSGAGAVDTAIAMALLANAPRRRVVCLSGNYSGKTLPSVNFSTTAPLLADRDLSAFEPYYPDAVYIDAFADDAEEQFLAAVSDGDVALVWFELIQGYMFKRLPAALVAAVERHKEQFGYLVGVDEVLTGMWKNGHSILFHMEEMSSVDVTTMSKATSDMVFPVSWALVTDELYRRASETNPRSVKFLQGIYRNNLGAAFALNGIRQGRAFFADGQLPRDFDDFRAELTQVVASSSLISGITSEGSLVRLNLNKKWFPYAEGSIEGTLVEGATSKLLLHATGILLTNLRMFLPAIHGRQERDEVLKRLSAGLARVTPESVYAYMLCQDYELLNMLGMKASFKTNLLESAAA